MYLSPPVRLSQCHLEMGCGVKGEGGQCRCVWRVSHLRGDVIRSTTKGLGCHAIPNVFFTHAKVSDLDVSLGIQHHIVKFEVTVADRSIEGFQEMQPASQPTATHFAYNTLPDVVGACPRAASSLTGRLFCFLTELDVSSISQKIG